jgi:hypothetical protein
MLIQVAIQIWIKELPKCLYQQENLFSFQKSWFMGWLQHSLQPETIFWRVPKQPSPPETDSPAGLLATNRLTRLT